MKIVYFSIHAYSHLKIPLGNEIHGWSTYTPPTHNSPSKTLALLRATNDKYALALFLLGQVHLGVLGGRSLTSHQ